MEARQPRQHAEQATGTDHVATHDGQSTAGTFHRRGDRQNVGKNQAMSRDLTDR